MIAPHEFATPPEALVDRLIALGATRLRVGGDGAVAVADPDGNEFNLLDPH